MPEYKHTYSGRQHWTIYGCFDESSAEPVAIKFHGTEYQAQKLSYALACAFNATPCWDGHTIAVNGMITGRIWRGGKKKKTIPEMPAEVAEAVRETA